MLTAPEASRYLAQLEALPAGSFAHLPAPSGQLFLGKSTTESFLSTSTSLHLSVTDSKPGPRGVFPPHLAFQPVTSGLKLQMLAPPENEIHNRPHTPRLPVTRFIFSCFVSKKQKTNSNVPSRVGKDDSTQRERSQTPPEETKWVKNIHSGEQGFGFLRLNLGYLHCGFTNF